MQRYPTFFCPPATKITSTPGSEYVSHRPTNRNSLPSYTHRTPSRRAPEASSSFRLPMTPSPKKHRPMPAESADDVFSSPARFSSPGPAKVGPLTLSYTFEDDEDDEFTGDDSGFAEEHSAFRSRTMIPPPSSSPFALRTPVKASRLDPQSMSRTHLTAGTAYTPWTPAVTATAGTKRKPTPLSFATPERKHSLTPLHTTGSCAFDRLAPLPLSAPRFGSRTPRTKAETEECLKSGEDSLTKLRIKDYDMTAVDSGFDSASDGLPPSDGSNLFTDRANMAKTKTKRPGLALFIEKGPENKDEVVESMSPSGHVNKRRARSRPVSKELLLSAAKTPMAKEHVVCMISNGLLK